MGSWNRWFRNPLPKYVLIRITFEVQEAKERVSLTPTSMIQSSSSQSKKKLVLNNFFSSIQGLKPLHPSPCCPIHSSKHQFQEFYVRVSLQWKPVHWSAVQVSWLVSIWYGFLLTAIFKQSGFIPVDTVCIGHKWEVKNTS